MKKLVFLVALLTITITASAETPGADNYNHWVKSFEALREDMPRLEAEKLIEKIRGVKSTYELYAMDISDIVVYKLDEKYILLVWYEPGRTAMKFLNGFGSPPSDGYYLRHQVTYMH